MAVAEAQFWLVLLQIIWINILLSGDNAVVIALAARDLPAKQRRIAIAGGMLGAMVVRIALIVVIASLLSIPYLKLVSGALLFWVAVKLLISEKGGDGKKDGIKAGSTILTAVAAITLADAAMSLDNVIGIVAAAKNDMTLIIIGLAISIPLVVYGSTLILRLIGRYPLLVVAGGALLGWIAGGIAVTDSTIESHLMPYQPMVHYAAGFCGAAFVVLTSRWLSFSPSRIADRDIMGNPDLKIGITGRTSWN